MRLCLIQTVKLFLITGLIISFLFFFNPFLTNINFIVLVSLFLSFLRVFLQMWQFREKMQHSLIVLSRIPETDLSATHWSVNHCLKTSIILSLFYVFVDFLGQNQRLAYSHKWPCQVHHWWSVQCFIQGGVLQLGSTGIETNTRDVFYKYKNFCADKVCPRQRRWNLWVSGVNFNWDNFKTSSSQCCLSWGLHQGWRRVSCGWGIPYITDMCSGLNSHTSPVHILVS